jgi:hypothetical protein
MAGTSVCGRQSRESAGAHGPDTGQWATAANESVAGGDWVESMLSEREATVKLIPYILQSSQTSRPNSQGPNSQGTTRSVTEPVRPVAVDAAADGVLTQPERAFEPGVGLLSDEQVPLEELADN